MPRSSQTRLALASEKPDTCTGPPRLSFPQGAKQEAHMSNFVPSGDLTFSDALDRVATILNIQKREALNLWARELRKITKPAKGEVVRLRERA